MSKIRIALSLIALIVVISFVLVTGDRDAIVIAINRLPSSALVEIAVVIAVGYMIASARVQTFAGYAGHSLRFQQAVAAVSAGQIAGNLFFQIVGQVMARSALFSRAGIPVATTIVITGSERISALVVSVLLAAAGALSIFGIISVNAESGGYDFAKLFLGGLVALAGGAALGWRSLVSLPSFNGRDIKRIAIGLALSAMIQLTTMAAYVLTAHALSPATPITGLAAASTVVMLAASLPISLAGWGVREVSAVLALGAVGVSPSDALISAVTIGVMSLVMAALLALVSHRAWSIRGSSDPASSPEGNLTHGYDFTRLLSTWLPLLAATAVLFQVYLPSSTGRINVNLADPLAIICGALFGLAAIRDKRWPLWRIRGVNAFLIAFSLSTGLALLIGYLAIGWTSWAFVNKGFGWIVLVCYLFTGAIFVSASKSKFETLLKAYCGSVATIAALELLLLLVRSLGLDLPTTLLSFRISGFAQNPNAFAFQILLAMAAIIILDMKLAIKLVLGFVLFAALWFSGSRAGFGTSLLLIAAAPLTLWGPSKRTMIRLAISAAVVLSATAVLTLMLPTGASVVYSFLYNQDNDRFATIWGGIELFLAHPIFGAGLGVFVHNYTARTGEFLPIHSTAAWLLAEYGIIGLTIVAGATAYATITCLRKALTGDRASRYVVLALIILSAMSLVHEMLYQRTFWLLIGVALACRRQNEVSALDVSTNAQSVPQEVGEPTADELPSRTRAADPLA